MFDALAFLRVEFGSVPRVIRACELAKVSVPNPAQVEKWIERESVPGPWLMTLMYVLERAGRPVRVGRYFGINRERSDLEVFT